MAGQRNQPNEKVIGRALELVTEAMDVLDGHGVAPSASAHLALAQQELRKARAG